MIDARGTSMLRCVPAWAGIALLLPVATLAGCVSTEPKPTTPAPVPVAATSSKSGSMDELQELLRAHSLASVQGVVSQGVQAESAPAAEIGDPAPYPPESTPESPVAEGAPAGPAENPYLAFGARIVVHGDGRVTKPYPLPPKKGKRLLDLLQLYGDFPVRFTIRGPNDAPASMPAQSEPVVGEVECMLLEEWDIELFQDMRVWPPAAAVPVALADWLVVTATPERLHEVEDFLNLFAASVPQIEIEAKIVEIVESSATDLGVKHLSDATSTTPIFDAPGTSTFIKGLDYSFPTSDPASALLTLGAVQNGVAFNAVLQALQTWDNVSVDSNPKIAVREGSRAEIVNIARIPFYNFSGINAANQYTATLTFEEVGVKLYVVPRVVGTDTVALNIDIEASQQVGSVVSFVTGGDNGAVLTNPIIAKRGAKTVVYLQPGQAVILGGLSTLRDTESIRKVPLLGDIPGLGALFRSKLTKKERTNVLFFIRPRILQGIDVQRDF